MSKWTTRADREINPILFRNGGYTYYEVVQEPYVPGAKGVTHSRVCVVPSTPRADYSHSPLLIIMIPSFGGSILHPEDIKLTTCTLANLRCCPFVAYKPHLAWRHQIHPCLKLCPGRSTSSYHPSFAHRSGYRFYPIRRLAYQWRLGEVLEQRHQCGSG